MSQKQPSRCVLGKGVLKICSQFTGEYVCQSSISIKLQLYWNRTSAWVFSCQFAAYFQNTFSWEHLWTTASDVTQCILSLSPCWYEWKWSGSTNHKFQKTKIVINDYQSIIRSCISWYKGSCLLAWCSRWNCCCWWGW